MNSGIPDRPFQVEGNNFPDFATAAQRSCDEQFQGCQEMANKAGNGNGNKNGRRGDGDGNGDGSGDGNGDGKDNSNDNGNDNGNNNGDGDGGRDAKGKGKGKGRDEVVGLTVNMCDQQRGESASLFLNHDVYWPSLVLTQCRAMQSSAADGPGSGLPDTGCEREYRARSAVSRL